MPTNLYLAAAEGDLRKVKAILATVKDVSGREGVGGEDALHVAARNGHIAVAECLLDAGAAIEGSFNAAYGQGATYLYHTKKSPLVLATENSQVEMVRCLIQRGAAFYTVRPNGGIDGDPVPIEIAISNIDIAHNGYLDILQIFLEHLPFDVFWVIIEDADLLDKMFMCMDLNIIEIILRIIDEKIKRFPEDEKNSLQEQECYQSAALSCILHRRDQFLPAVLQLVIQRKMLDISELTPCVLLSFFKDYGKFDHATFKAALAVLIKGGANPHLFDATLPPFCQSPMTYLVVQRDIDALSTIIDVIQENGGVANPSPPKPENGEYEFSPLLIATQHASDSLYGDDEKRASFRSVIQIFLSKLLEKDLNAFVCSSQDVNTLEMFLKAGYELDAKNPKNGRTALHLASIESTQLLLASGAHCNLQDNAGDTPLHIAVAKGNLNKVKMLINAGALLNVPNGINAMPLHYCADADFRVNEFRPEIVKVLLEAGANPNIKDNTGLTPLYRVIIIMTKMRERMSAVRLHNYGGLEGMAKYLIVYGSIFQLAPSPQFFSYREAERHFINKILSKLSREEQEIRKSVLLKSNSIHDKLPSTPCCVVS